MVEQMPVHFSVIRHLRPNTPLVDLDGVSAPQRFNWDNAVSARLDISKIILRDVFAKPIVFLEVLNTLDTNYILLE